LIKVIDNSVISSMGREIRSVKILPIVKSVYDVRLTAAVIVECRNSKDKGLTESIDGLLFAIEEDSRFKQTVDMIRRVDLRLGLGEVNTIAASIILTHNRIENYAVIDDGLARSAFKKILRNKTLVNEFGDSMSRVRITGTVGLINRLRTKGMLTSDQCNAIAKDLENSSFRISDELLDLLK
jgi:predicted nucleic acid-binding protein